MPSNRQEPETGISLAKATAFVVLALLAGFWGGYLYRGQAESGLSGPHSSAATAPLADRSSSAPQAFTERDLQMSLALLKKDPKNRQALVQVGNIYYDTQRYEEAIQYYNQALALDPNDVNVRTDLGTAYWYTGKPKEAVDNFNLALQLRPAYPQTLFNLGVVRLHGLNDPEGAIAAWEKLLASNPGYPEAGKVREQIEQARALLKVKSSTK
jgi:tetratricopeptide (TPR) repeat protein